MLHFARVAASAGRDLPAPAREAIGELVAALGEAEGDPGAATGHTAAACGCASAMDSSDIAGLTLANVVKACADDLQRVVDLRP